MVTVTGHVLTVLCKWFSQLLHLILYLNRLSVGIPEEESLSDPTGIGAHFPSQIGL
jgi:hypothetical protein